MVDMRLTGRFDALRVGEIAAAMYIASLPFDHATALENICLAMTVAAMLLVAYRDGHQWPPLMPAFGLWFLAAAASLAWSHDPAASLDAIWRDILKTVVVFSAFYTLARRGADVAVMMRIVSIVAIAFSGVAITDFLVHRSWQGHFSPPRYDVGVAALTWGAFIAMMLVRLMRGKVPKGLLGLGLTALVALSVAGYMGGSRAFALAYFCGLLLLALLYWRRNGVGGWGFAIWGALLALGATVVVTISNRSMFYLGHREILYGRTLDKIRANLWQGTGFGHETDKAWYTTAFQDLPDWVGVANATHPHNIVLSYMDQMGIWGLLVIVVLFVSIVRPLLAAVRSPDPTRAYMGWAGMMLVLFFAISNSSNFYFGRQHLWMFFAVLGLCYGWLARDGEKGQ